MTSALQIPRKSLTLTLFEFCQSSSILALFNDVNHFCIASEHHSSGCVLRLPKRIIVVVSTNNKCARKIGECHHFLSPPAASTTSIRNKIILFVNRLPASEIKVPARITPNCEYNMDKLKKFARNSDNREFYVCKKCTMRTIMSFHLKTLEIQPKRKPINCSSKWKDTSDEFN